MTDRQLLDVVVFVYKRPFIPPNTVESHALPRRPKFFQRDLAFRGVSSRRNDGWNARYEPRRRPMILPVKPSRKWTEIDIHRTQAILLDEIKRQHACIGELASLTLQSRYEVIHTRELQLQDLGSVPIGKHALLGRVERQLCPRIDNLTDDRQPLHQDGGAQPGYGVLFSLKGRQIYQRRYQ